MSSDEVYIFTKLTWKGDKHQAYFMFSRINDDKIENKLLKPGSLFNIRFLGGKYCIGTEVARGQWITCSNNTSSETKSLVSGRQCSDCLSTSFFNCRMTCTGQFCRPSSKRAKEICTPPNTSIYLTSIAGIKKVGVSLNLPGRWIEQGSDFAVRIAEAPGLQARQIEQLIAQEMGLKLQIRNSTKIKNLSVKSEITEKKRLNELIDKSSELIDLILQNCEGQRYESPEIIEFDTLYGYEIPKENILETIPKNMEEFGGEIIAVKGSILIVRRDNYYFALDLKKIIGTRFKFIDQAKMDTQTSLDEWF